MNLENKVVVVTGAGSGIGRELTIALLERGAKVTAVDIRKESLDELKNLVEKKENLSTYVLDISDKKAVDKFPIKMLEDLKEIDGIINNAGIIQPFVKVNELNFDTIDRVMNINFYGTLYMTKAFLPFLLKRPEAHIVNVSSMGGFLPVPGQSIYGASKAAVKLFSEGLWAELAGTNVHVTTVFPGATETNITANSGLKPQIAGDNSKKQSFPMLSPGEAAKIILDGVEKNKPQIFVGKDCKLMNNLYRLNPMFAINLILKQMKSLLGN